MAIVSAAGNKTNVANFDKLVIDVGALGSVYAPTKPNIKMDALNIQNTKNKLVDANETSTLFALNNAKNNRVDSIAKTNDLITRSSNSVRASDIPQSTKEDLLAIAAFFLGRARAVKRSVVNHTAQGDVTTTTTAMVTNPKDIDSRISYLESYIKLLATVTTYNPNEANIKVANLTTVLNDIKAKRAAELNAEAAHKIALIARNEAMYAPGTGIIDIANDVKAYVKSVFGASSQQYKTLTTLKFKKIV